MFDLTTTNEVQTMTSREIAELTGKGHPEVMRDVRNMVSKLEKADLLSLVKTSSYIGANGIKYPQYELDKDSCLTLLLGYDVVARMKVVKRWQELEATKPALNLNDPKQLLGLLQNYAERTLELENKVVVQEEVIAITSQQLEEAAPKVEFVDKYVEASGLLGFREVAKMLSIKEAVLRAWLVDTGAMYRLGAGWAFKAQWLDSKRGVHKTSYDVYGRAVVSAKFTPKGFAYIAERISK